MCMQYLQISGTKFLDRPSSDVKSLSRYSLPFFNEFLVNFERFKKLTLLHHSTHHFHLCEHCSLQEIRLGVGTVGVPVIFHFPQFTDVLQQTDFNLYCFSWIILFLETYYNKIFFWQISGCFSSKNKNLILSYLFLVLSSFNYLIKRGFLSQTGNCTKAMLSG